MNRQKKCLIDFVRERFPQAELSQAASTPQTSDGLQSYKIHVKADKETRSSASKYLQKLVDSIAFLKSCQDLDCFASPDLINLAMNVFRQTVLD
jgi:hypothetical protein